MSSLRWGDAEIDAVVFDLFHTLVDPQQHAPPGFRRLDAVAGILDLPLLDIELWWEQVVDELVAAPVSPVDALVDLARSRRIVLTPTAIAELDRAMGGHADRALADPIDGVVPSLERLAAAGVGTVILSNALVRDVRAYPASPLAVVVDAACMSCFTGLVKPDPVAYHRALERIRSVPERSLFVGDGGSDEFVGARAAGCAAVVAVTGAVEKGGWRSEQAQRRVLEQADAHADSVADVVARLLD
jgi:putative hydrolase of the HAD superfamily